MTKRELKKFIATTYDVKQVDVDVDGFIKDNNINLRECKDVCEVVGDNSTTLICFYYEEGNTYHNALPYIKNHDYDFYFSYDGAYYHVQKGVEEFSEEENEEGFVDTIIFTSYKSKPRRDEELVAKTDKILLNADTPYNENLHADEITIIAEMSGLLTSDYCTNDEGIRYYRNLEEIYQS